MKFFIHTFGCQMNVSDSEHIAGMLSASGMTPSPNPEESDVIIVNTCAVREKSEEKFFSFLGRLESLKREKGTMIGVVGCIAQLHKSKIWDKKGQGGESHCQSALKIDLSLISPYDRESFC